MSAAKKTRDQILSMIPDDAVRVKVIDEKGNERYRDVASDGLDAILDSDEIVVHRGKLVVMQDKPGRRKQAPVPKPPPPVNQTVAVLVQQKQEFFENDALLQQLESGIDAEDVLHLVMTGFAQEAASLNFERIEAERTGKETSQLSIRRINALKALGETWIKRKEQLAGRMIDLESPAFRKLFEFMLDCFRESMHKGGVPRDQAETVFVELSERMTDETWEEEARKRMRGS
jgi:hypothetical protein